MSHQGFWQEVSGVFQYCNEAGSGMSSSLMCFSARITDRIVKSSDCVLVKVQLLDEAFYMETSSGYNLVPALEALPQDRLAVLKVSHTEYDTLVCHVTELRILQASLLCQDDIYIIDTMQAPACIAGSVITRPGESLQVAELFSGGFMGWSRAGYVLRACGLRCHTSWCLDSDDTCITPASFLEPGLDTASSPQEIPSASEHKDCVFLRADPEADWCLPQAACPGHLSESTLPILELGWISIRTPGFGRPAGLECGGHYGPVQGALHAFGRGVWVCDLPQGP